MKKLFLITFLLLIFTKLVFADSSMVFRASSGLTGLSDVGSSTTTAGRLLVADGTKFQSVAYTIGGISTGATSTTNLNDQSFIFMGATSATNYTYPINQNQTVSKIVCVADAGTATVDFKQCLLSWTSGCNTVLNNTLSLSSTRSEASIKSAASSLTGGNQIQFAVTSATGLNNFGCTVSTFK